MRYNAALLWVGHVGIAVLNSLHYHRTKKEIISENQFPFFDSAFMEQE